MGFWETVGLDATFVMVVIKAHNLDLEANNRHPKTSNTVSSLSTTREINMTMKSSTFPLFLLGALIFALNPPAHAAGMLGAPLTPRRLDRVNGPGERECEFCKLQLLCLFALHFLSKNHVLLLRNTF
jgi:hypothetical protein